MIEYKFGNVQEYDIPSSPEIDTPTSPETNLTWATTADWKSHKESIATSTEGSWQPAYIPSYFPPFPEIKEDDTAQEEALLQKQQQLEEQKQQQLQQQQQQQQTSSSLPLPVIVKHRKKPIDNPFTHIIPFDESSLASEDVETSPQKPLSLSLTIGSKRKDGEEEASALKRLRASVVPLTEALNTMKNERPTYRIGEGLADRDELFKAQTQNAAVPGNYLFNPDSGVFDELVRNVAEPLIISKLTAPNLLIDIATTTSNTPTPIPPFDYGSPGSMPTSPDGSKISRSASMLAVLAGGASSKKAGLKQLNKLAKTKAISSQPNHTISKHSVDINAIKTGDSKYIIKKKRMLAEKQQALERQKLIEQRLKENPNADLSDLNPPPPPPPLQNTTAATIARTPHLPPPPPPPTTTTSIQSKQKPSSSTTGPISLSSFSSSTVEKEKKKKHKKTPKLTLNFSQPSSAGNSATPSPNTPKIRFKIKPPEQQQQQQQQQQGSSIKIKLSQQQPENDSSSS
jgi:hypothetical protein